MSTSTHIETTVHEAAAKLDILRESLSEALAEEPMSEEACIDSLLEEVYREHPELRGGA